MNKYQDKALQAVAHTYGLMPHELYVVWFCKTLQNWKALISSGRVNGVYWEVTYNGDKAETYVDEYVKFKNTALPD